MASDEETVQHDRQDDPAWQHCTSVDGGRRFVRCNWCGKQMHGGIHRFKGHLAGIKGQVKSCDKCPKELKAEMRAILLGKKAIKETRQKYEAELREEISGRRREESIPVRAPGVSLRGLDDPEHLHVDSDSDEDPIIRAARRESLHQLELDEERRRSGAGPSGARVGSGSGSGSASVASSRRAPPETEIGGGIGMRTLDAFAFRRRSSKQPMIKQAMRGMKKGAEATASAVKSITKWFLHAGVPAHAATSPYFQSMLDAVGDHGPGLKAPTPFVIYGSGLDAEVAELQTWVDNFKNVWKERGCSLMCDGWTGTTRKSMINFLVYCTEGTVFQKSIDASYQSKSANYLFGLMDDMIEIIGEEYVVQVVTDNEASYKAAGKKLMDKRKHLYWVPCAAHCMDLMLEDIGKDKFVSQVVHEAQKVTQFIYGHNRILNMMRANATEGRDLIRAGPTRFASNFISLESLQKHKHNLITFFNSTEYLQYCNHSLKDDSILVAGEVGRIVGDNNFWDRVAYYLKVIEPLVQVLRMVDGDDKNDMGYLYEAMDKAKEKIKKKFPTGYKKWWSIIDRRWDMTLHHPLHAAGYFLNPRFQYSDDVHNDAEVIDGTIKVIRRLSRNDNDRIDAEREMESYRLRLGTYGEREMQNAIMRVSPAEWWVQINHRDQMRNPLAYIAIRVLSQTTASSQCERNWSTFSLIHSKVRNRLQATRLEKLVFCHYNMRLRLKTIRQRQRLQEKRASELAGRQYVEEVADATGQIDVEELLEDEHPLNSWVETRAELDQPLFDPDDREWAEGILDHDEARDPELQTFKRRRQTGSQSTPPPEEPPLEPARRSDSLPPTPRMATIPMRRSASQIERIDQAVRDDPAIQKMKQILSRTGNTQAESQEKRTKEKKQHQKKISSQSSQGSRHSSKKKLKLPVHTDSETQPPSDDDGGAAEGGSGHGGQQQSTSLSECPGMQGGAGEGAGGDEGETHQQGYQGHQAPMFDWGYGYYQPHLAPLSFDNSSSRHGTTYSGVSSSQHGFTPRGIQQGFHDMAESLFSYGYGQYMQPSYHGGERRDDDDEESSSSHYPY